MKDLRLTIRDSLLKVQSRCLDDELDRAVVEQMLFLDLAAMFGEACAAVSLAKQKGRKTDA